MTTIAYMLESDGATKETTVMRDGVWTNIAYRTLTFNAAFTRDTNPDFYDWFVANAVKQ